MAKQKTSYACGECAFTSIKWMGCCPGCEAWNTLVEQKAAPTVGTAAKAVRHARAAKLSTFDEITIETQHRMKTGIGEWDRVMGGGILPGSFLILTGDPGIGKSTLLLDVAHRISKHAKVLYFSSEESLEQVKNRAVRLKCTDGNVHLSDEALLESIIATGKAEKPALLIVDSIQNCYFSDGSTLPGTVGQLRESAFHLMRLAKEHGIAVLTTGHITKEGVMAGPKLLEHMVDGVFYLQGEDRWHTRVLRCVKNRFGTIHETGFFEMSENGLQEISNINEHLISATSTDPGAALVSSMEGTRPILLEMQALCVASKFGNPQRVVTGVDPKRVVLIAAILEKYLKIKLSAQDIFFKVGSNLKIKESAADLGIALALLSSYFQVPLPKKSIAIGEISLTGQIKPINQIAPRVKEAEKFGIEQILVSRSQQLKATARVLNFRNVYELLSLFPGE